MPGPAPPSARELLRTAALALAALAAGSLVFFGPGILTGRELLFTHDIRSSDLWHLHLPLKHVYARGLAAGRLPLWCPEVGTGFPLLAEGQVGALYPPNLLLFSTLPLPLAFDWALLLQVFL